MMRSMIHKLKKHGFLLEELIKRDFKQKYKGTTLGMAWSVLSPLLTLLVMKLVFTQFFGRTTPHYTTYLFAGTIVYSFFKESTKSGMSALRANAKIFSKINVPKWLFLLAKNASCVLSFLLTLIVFFAFAAMDGITFSWKMLMLIYPIAMLTLMNIGLGLILSALYMFFKDTQYLYDVFLRLLHYVSAIFYTVESYPAAVQKVFLLNPVYCFIKYFRLIVINGSIPSVEYHALLFFYAAAAILVGGVIYKKKNHTFIYYV